MKYNNSDMYMRRLTDVNASLNGEIPLGEIEYQLVNPKNDTVYAGASMFRNVTIPLICALGIIGNVLTIATLLTKLLQKTSFNRYIIARSASDVVFLTVLLFVWLDTMEVRIFHTNVICQMVVFASYVSSFLSVWMVVAVTCENYIRLCHPMTLRVYCTAEKARNVTITLTLLAVTTYSFSLWITNMDTIGGKDVCVTNARYQDIYIIMTYVDTVLTLVLPFLVIIVLCTAIILSTVDAYKRRKRRMTASDAGKGKLELFSLLPQARMTRMLFAISLIFLVLHFPFHVIRLKMIISIYILKSRDVTPTDPTLKKAFETIYYSNFAVNFLVYFVFGSLFRRRFFALFCDCVIRRSSPIQRQGRSVRTDTSDMCLVSVKQEDCDVDYDATTVV